MVNVGTFAKKKKKLPKSALKEPDLPPHFGGERSKEAVLLVVDFSYVTENNDFREMINSMQAALLTGGVNTNAFRPKQKKSPNG